MRTLAWLILLVVSSSALADGKPLYRYTDKDGHAHYTDQPPFKGAKPLVLYNQNAPTVKRKWADAAAAETIRKAARFAVHVSTPTPGQVYRDAADGVPVAVSVMPGLAKDFGLSFRVDDVAQYKKPVGEIHTVLHGLSAGKHALTAVLISPEGVELVRSTPINIEIKTSLARN